MVRASFSSSLKIPICPARFRISSDSLTSSSPRPRFPLIPRLKRREVISCLHAKWTSNSRSNSILRTWRFLHWKRTIRDYRFKLTIVQQSRQFLVGRLTWPIKSFLHAGEKTLILPRYYVNIRCSVTRKKDFLGKLSLLHSISWYLILLN